MEFLPIIKEMHTEGVFAILPQIISSWQVIVISIALVLYLNIIFYVARAHHYRRPKMPKKFKFKKKEPAAAEIAASDDMDGSSNDDLGLEEA